MLNFALIGCGRIASRHAELLSLGFNGRAKLTAVCDLIEEKAKFLGKKYNVPYFLDMHDMIDRHKEIDVLCILTESGNHAKNVIELAKYNKDFIVEKPMALNLDHADDMILECEKFGNRLFIVKQNRFNLPVLKLKDAIDSQRFGDIFMSTVRVRWCRTQAYYNQDNWRGTWALDGGVITNQASHHVDLMIWLLGKVESVFAKSMNAIADIEAEDTAGVILKFTNGAIGILEATTAIRPKDLEGSISVLGKKGNVEIGGFAVNKLLHWNFEETLQSDIDVLKNFSENPPNIYGFGHSRYYEHVIDSILSKKQHMVDGFEGRKSLEVISAIYESIETEKEVFLRFKPRKCKLGFSA